MKKCGYLSFGEYPFDLCGPLTKLPNNSPTSYSRPRPSPTEGLRPACVATAPALHRGTATVSAAACRAAVISVNILLLTNFFSLYIKAKTQEQTSKIRFNLS